ncbi:ribose-5-phosphate isomerase [Nesterenkonia natronophila]|uniref:Ribose-5-phosphate isomerase B n=1 Tax=Nesterenkonia natronophila TaxID=2174932 RepID=A0A3A4FG70_9MICC|nr:ribose-5-phosphate isomerase [Nesterenkonia natronophila]RJN31295.1 ribose-5-phosphate isomerase [Nesterenkonia natronophila]
MRVHIATDHAGMEVSAHLVQQLTAKGYEVIDHGPREYDAQDDYPGFCLRAATAVAEDWAGHDDADAPAPALGIVLGGSGNGEQIAANKVAGIRAALAWNRDTARLAREHNNANVVGIGGRQHSREEAAGIVEEFLTAEWSGEPRHTRRIGKISHYETTGEILD